MSEQSYSIENEIDISEIFAILWSHKIVIFLITVFSIFLAGYFALTSNRQYTAKAIFEIKQENTASFNLSGELGALASLAGFGNTGSSDSRILLERMSSREFILKFSDKASLRKDPFFNTYDPNHVDPLWKATLKKLIGWTTVTSNYDAAVEKTIIYNYNEFISARTTDSGAFSVSVIHENPNLAAKYANDFMDYTRTLVETENRKAQELKLSYLSETLADALQDMEAAQQNLKEYALKNSALAQENFISGSLKLDALRMEKREVMDISKVLNVVSNLIQSGNTSNEAYNNLRSTYPLVDDIKFRRILGMSETISDWSWPDIETSRAVSTTLRDRLNRLELEIKSIEDNAKIYATSAEDLAKLTRSAKVSEATYTVLIEQVKSQALAAGFKPDTFRVFEYASAPTNPSSPKRKLILVIGFVLGIFAGCTLALISSVYKNVYYTRRSLLSEIQPNIFLSAKPFRRVARWPTSRIKSHLSKRKILEVDEAAIELSDKKLVYILDCGGKTSAANMARLLAIHSSSTGRHVVLCDKTGQSEKEIEDKTAKKFSDVSVTNLENSFDVIRGAYKASFFTSLAFGTTIKKMIDEYDQIFVCSDRKEAIIGLMALKSYNPSVVLLAREQKTRRRDIRKIIANRPVDILFHD